AVQSLQHEAETEGIRSIGWKLLTPHLVQSRRLDQARGMIQHGLDETSEIAGGRIEIARGGISEIDRRRGETLPVERRHLRISETIAQLVDSHRTGIHAQRA